MAIKVLNSETPINNINSYPLFNINENISVEDTAINSNSILHNNTIISSISPIDYTIFSIETNSQINRYYVFIINTNPNLVNPDQVSFAPSYPIRFYI